MQGTQVVKMSSVGELRIIATEEKTKEKRKKKQNKTLKHFPGADR